MDLAGRNSHSQALREWLFPLERTTFRVWADDNAAPPANAGWDVWLRTMPVGQTTQQMLTGAKRDAGNLGLKAILLSGGADEAQAQALIGIALPNHHYLLLSGDAADEWGQPLRAFCNLGDAARFLAEHWAVQAAPEKGARNEQH